MPKSGRDGHAPPCAGSAIPEVGSPDFWWSVHSSSTSFFLDCEDDGTLHFPPMDTDLLPTKVSLITSRFSRSS